MIDARVAGLEPRCVTSAVGGLETALGLLKKELQLSDDEEVEVVLYPRPKSLWQSLLEGDLLELSGHTESCDLSLDELLGALKSPGPWLLLPEVTIQ